MKSTVEEKAEGREPAVNTKTERKRVRGGGNRNNGRGSPGGMGREGGNVVAEWGLEGN